jgi:hypothetical protein
MTLHELLQSVTILFLIVQVGQLNDEIEKLKDKLEA